MKLFLPGSYNAVQSYTPSTEGVLPVPDDIVKSFSSFNNKISTFSLISSSEAADILLRISFLLKHFEH